MKNSTIVFDLMKSFGTFITVVILATIPFSRGDWHARWSESGTTWYEKWDNVIKSIDTFSLDERMEILGKAVCLAPGPEASAEKWEIFTRAQTRLLSDPGHAKYYKDKIEAMRAEVLVNSKKSEAEISKMQDKGLEVVSEWHYSPYCETIAFPTLSHLPSPETVAVLGFYLNDPEGRDGKNITGRNIELEGGPGRLNVNAEAAAIAIRKLGIEHPPFPIYDDHGMRVVREGEIDAWKSWWNDVKAGRRTYRFKGSKIEYGADGPASREVIERAAINRKRDEERSTGKRHASPGSEADAPARTPAKPASIAAILAACTLLAVAIWYFLKGRRKAA